MDPLSQAVLGASVPVIFAKKEEIRPAAVMGALAGMAPDLDILIRSSSDPLLHLQFHRHFTHSLFFVPLGALLCAVFLFPLFKRFTSLGFKRLYLFSFVGYLTHAPLDCCTSYGTSWLWPFSSQRIAWENIAVIDPLFTLPMLFFLILACYQSKKMFAQIGFCFGILILLLGVVQRERATAAVEAFAEARGHEVQRLAVHPTLGNLLLWRSTYRSGDLYYVDAVRLKFFEENRVYEGSSVPVFVPDYPAGSVLDDDVSRFYKFSSGWLAKHPENQNIIGDIRYALVPNSVYPLWGIVIDENNPEEHCVFLNFRDVSDEKKQRFFNMLLGREM